MDSKAANAKVDISVNGIAFTGEGDQAWLAQQLDKILNTATEIAKTRPVVNGVGRISGSEDGVGSASPSNESVGTLAGFIRAKSGDGNQVRRFLATASWLRSRGEENLTTAKVSKALTDHQQKRLGNPADSLNQNVAKGHCEKTPTGFFITPDGFKELGQT